MKYKIADMINGPFGEIFDTLEEAEAALAEEIEQGQQKRQLIVETPLEFVSRDDLCAVPTLGGILSDRGVPKLIDRFPDAVLLPVSKRLADEYLADGPNPTFVIVDWEGRGVAVTPQEAEAKGLDEAPNWVPDLSGVPVVPHLQDFRKVGL